MASALMTTAPAVGTRPAPLPDGSRRVDVAWKWVRPRVGAMDVQDVPATLARLTLLRPAP
jgi:hypothetical protein